MVRLKKARHSTNMAWFDNVTVRINGYQETECELEVTQTMIHIIYPGNELITALRKIDCAQVNAAANNDLFNIVTDAGRHIQIRFASNESRMAFSEAAFPDRNSDSGNSSLAPTPSPPDQ